MKKIFYFFAFVLIFTTFHACIEIEDPQPAQIPAPVSKTGNLEVNVRLETSAGQAAKSAIVKLALTLDSAVAKKYFLTATADTWGKAVFKDIRATDPYKSYFIYAESTDGGKNYSTDNENGSGDAEARIKPGQTYNAEVIAAIDKEVIPAGHLNITVRKYTAAGQYADGAAVMLARTFDSASSGKYFIILTANAQGQVSFNDLPANSSSAKSYFVNATLTYAGAEFSSTNPGGNGPLEARILPNTNRNAVLVITAP
ncbi:MAG: hypothetical protein EOP53_14135 [Sphingobacteriales bacterium]|nr:MAG: hypothetical protein EOP53_14135 [Sphingobacteriales bacterium]